MDCVFCKIADGKIPSDVIYEDEDVIAFNDLDPQAPIHFLVIPKKHIESIASLKETDLTIVGHIFDVIKKIAKDKGLNDKGYRVLSNVGEDGGQTVPHLHFHVLGGRGFKWPPGWFEHLCEYERGDSKWQRSELEKTNQSIVQSKDSKDNAQDPVYFLNIEEENTTKNQAL